MKSGNPISEIDASWLAQLLQTTDSIFPTGSYAHSFGLEGAVQMGLVTDADSLRQFLERSIVPALENFELPFVRFAFDAANDGAIATLCELDQRYGAMKGSRELRHASARIGSQRLSMLRQLNPHPLFEQLETARVAGEFEGHSPIVFGTQAAVATMPVDVAITAYFYQCTASLLSASLKLVRIGQIGCQSQLTALLAKCPEVIRRSRNIDVRDAGWFSPALDIASAQHETAYTRLFIS